MLELEYSSLFNHLNAMNQDFHELARAAGKAAQAECVYVFGSRARGDALPDSDLDMALIIADGASPRKALRAAIAATAQRRHSIDLVVIAHSTWTLGRSLLAREVQQDGVLVYGHGH
jgi:predicted nucleotidyltransferase